jgi:NADPH-dependent 2,4-dienoyl-CoA reductase/sulfur reductase-like enzyme
MEVGRFLSYSRRYFFYTSLEKAQMEKVDVVIIGAGVVGLAIASEIAC